MLLAVLSTDFSHRWFRWGVACVCALGLLAGCASTAVVEHGFFVMTSVANERVYDIQIDYGEKVIKFYGASNSGSGSSSRMPIPDSMTVHWTVHGVRKQVTIPLVDKLVPFKPLENWRLVFVGEDVQLWREVLAAPPATPTGLRPRERTKVFP